ncbi:MAG: hypothetical protein KF726_18525 [Anaerolineae bacterium]|nr:hypothetical protein [Anaerolineae bacterium]
MIHVNLADAEVEVRNSRLDAATVSAASKLPAHAGKDQMNQLRTTVNDWDCDVEVNISSDPMRLPAPLHWLTMRSARLLSAISLYAARFSKDRTESKDIVTEDQLEMLIKILGGLGRDGN